MSNRLENEKVTKQVYSANSRQDETVWKVLAIYFEHVYSYRWHLLVSVRGQVASTYSQDVFGLFWSLVMPVIPMTVYMILAHVKVFNTVDSIPFVFYITSGMLVWLMMAEVIRKIMLSLKQEKAVLVTTNYPAIVAMAMRAGEVLNDTLIRLVVFFGVVFWFGIDISLQGVILFFLMLIFSFFIAFAIGVLLSVLDIVYQDTRRLVDIFLRYGIFVSSVIFPFPTDGVLGAINSFNVVNTCVTATRFLFISADIDVLTVFLTLVSGVLLVLFSFKVLYVVEYRLRAYI